MNEMNPDAVYDVLYISSRLQKKITDFSMYEIQFFGYFSCLLSLYDGISISDWNYSFIRAEFGIPYSVDLHKALTHLHATGLISELEESKGYFTLTARGEELLNFYNDNISLTKWRRKYLDTACDSISLVPFGTIKDALNDEPVLKSASNSTMKKTLLTDSNPALHVLHGQFKALKEALENNDSELIVPAVVWLQALNQKQTVANKS